MEFFVVPADGTMSGRQLPQAQTRLVADERVQAVQQRLSSSQERKARCRVVVCNGANAAGESFEEKKGVNRGTKWSSWNKRHAHLAAHQTEIDYG